MGNLRAISGGSGARAENGIWRRERASRQRLEAGTSEESHVAEELGG